MAIYSKNTHVLENVQTPEPTEGYVGENGFARIMIDNVQNEHALFEALIMNDFEEVALGESATMEQLQPIYEASIGGFFAKIIEFLKKIWAKIVNLFKVFKEKLIQLFTKDYAAYVKKTKQAVIAKDLTKFKFKARMGKSGTFAVGGVKFAEPSLQSEDVLSMFNEKTTTDDLDKAISSLDEDFKLKVYNEMHGLDSSEISDIPKDFIDKYFEDEEEIEGLKSEQLNSILSVLTEYKSIIKDLETSEGKVNKQFKKETSALAKLSKKYADMQPKGGTDGDKKITAEQAAVSSKIVSYTQKLSGINSAAYTEFSKNVMTLTKLSVSESWKVYKKAVTFNPKAVKESTVLFNAIDESVDYEMELAFE